jgi:FdhD protein
MERPQASDDAGDQTQIEGDGAPILSWVVERVRESERQQLNEFVVLEEPLEVVINGCSVAVLMRMPGQEKELATGFAVSEGYVRRPDDILLLHHCGSGHPSPLEEDSDVGGTRSRVEMRVADEGFSPPERPDVIRLIRAGCGAAQVTALAEALPRVEQRLSVSASVLLGLGKTMRDLQTIHGQAGGTHAAVLFDKTGQPVAASEDIGRHNAVDKAIGHCMIWGIPLQDKVLLTSGRASYEMVTKALRAGVPIVASVSSPTSLAVQLADDRGLTLVGYLRGGRMSVYTHARRLENA